MPPVRTVAVLDDDRRVLTSLANLLASVGYGRNSLRWILREQKSATWLSAKSSYASKAPQSSMLSGTGVVSHLWRGLGWCVTDNEVF
jgi:hypothetical protein